MNKLNSHEKIYVNSLVLLEDNSMAVDIAEALDADDNLKPGYIIVETEHHFGYYKYDPEYIVRNFNTLDLTIKIDKLKAIRDIKFWITFWSTISVVGIVIGIVAVILFAAALFS